jgi:hypothetical protein
LGCVAADRANLPRSASLPIDQDPVDRARATIGFRYREGHRTFGASPDDSAAISDDERQAIPREIFLGANKVDPRHRRSFV